MTEIDYITTDNQIRGELLECRRLFTRAVTDISAYDTWEKIVQDYPGFQRELFKTHKVALKILVDRILELEGLLSETTGAAHPRSPDARTLKLHFWKRVLESSYNAFVWIYVGMDRSNAARVFKGAKHGDLADQNVASVLHYANEVNEDPNRLAIPLDFCSFAPISDVLQITYSETENVRRTEFYEIKSGKVNHEMVQAIDAGTLDAYVKFFDTYGERGIKQMERYFRQLSIFHKSHKLINARPGIYENPESGREPIIVLPNEAKVVHFHEKIIELLERAERGEFAVDVIDNCLVVGAFNGDAKNTQLLGEYDLRLYIYNGFLNPAAFLNREPYPDDIAKVLWDIGLTDWIEGVSSVVLEPILLRKFPDRHVVDLLLGKKRLRFFFSPESFVALCNHTGLKAEVTTTKQANRLRSSGPKKGLAQFDGRFVRLFLGDAVGTLGDGLLHEMLFNWVRPASIIEQMKQHKLTPLS